MSFLGKADISPFNINLLDPALGRGFGVVETEERLLTLRGRVDNPRQFKLVTINDKPINLDENGMFKEDIELQAGKNLIRFEALNHSFQFQLRTVEVDFNQTLKSLASSGKMYALIVAIGDYESFPDLKTPNDDARDIAEILSKQFGFLIELPNIYQGELSLVLQDATLADIQRALVVLRKQLTDQDSLLIYFAGHGTYLGENKEAYWLPRDAQPDDEFSWFSASSLIHSIKRMNARSVLILSDSCFSGAMSREPPDLGAFDQDRKAALLKQSSRKSRIFISSGGTEPVLDAGCTESPNHSIFACAFLKALKEIKEPIFSSGELHQMYLLPGVSGKSQQQPERKEIRDSDHDNGDFIFIRR